MIAAYRDCTARRRVDEQDRRRLARADRVEQVQLEADQIVRRYRRRVDYVESGHNHDYSRGKADPRIQSEKKMRDFVPV